MLTTTTTTTRLYRQAGQFKSGVDFENVTSTSEPNLCGGYTLFDAHCVFGHPSFKALDLMVKRGQLNPVKVNKVKEQHQIENCPECVIIKLVRTPHSSRTESNNANHPPERIREDLSGPYEIRGEKVHFMAIRDEFLAMFMLSLSVRRPKLVHSEYWTTFSSW